MSEVELDRIDEGVLYHLQRDARNATMAEMGADLGVAGSTVRNRIARLEAAGVIDGYRTEIDHGVLGFRTHVVFQCGFREGEDHLGADLEDDILAQDGVIQLRALLAEKPAFLIEAVAVNADEVFETTENLRTLGLEILRCDFVEQARSVPFNNFEHDFSDGDG